MEDLQLLQKLGMTRSESKIYMTLLRHGPLTAGKIVTLSKQHISVTYAALRRLVEKGHITRTKKGRFDAYFATEPEILLEKTKELEQSLKEKMPNWRKMMEMSESQLSVEVFEGVEGMRSMFNQMMKDAKKGDEYRVFTLGKENAEAIRDLFGEIGYKRNRKGIHTRAITNKEYGSTWDEVEDSKYLKSLNLRLVSFDFPQGVVIFKDTVTLFSWGKIPKAIHIKDTTLFKEYEKFFDKLYEKGEPYIR